MRIKLLIAAMLLTITGYGQGDTVIRKTITIVGADSTYVKTYHMVPIAPKLESYLSVHGRQFTELKTKGDAGVLHNISKADLDSIVRQIVRETHCATCPCRLSSGKVVITPHSGHISGAIDDSSRKRLSSIIPKDPIYPTTTTIKSISY